MTGRSGVSSKISNNSIGNEAKEGILNSIVNQTVSDMWKVSFDGLGKDMVRGLKNLGAFVDDNEQGNSISSRTTSTHRNDKNDAEKDKDEYMD
jgi:hypothetical protein